jgi:hypothetical protein
MRFDSGLGAMLLALITSLMATGCFHSVIDTGLKPGPVGYEEEWESAWLIGAVPARVNATEACRGPWARVETQQSFLNGIVTVLTLGIYAPHQVEVTCARTPVEASGEEAGGSASP